MIHLRLPIACSVALALGLLVPAGARAASLQKVNNWGASGVPSTASMYIYVPDKPATKPPILVLSHYCGGTASAVFGQAQGGKIVQAADQYGFIMIVPQTSANCWDVGSTKSLTHDGGGDTQAVAQMVKYAITTYQANPDRVYATGDSSGGMMTQGLLAVYPDVFKGGSAFAGVPAGCWAVGNPDGSWSSACAGGQVTHTPAEWGDLVRGMDAGYSGHRPRVQLVHGDADTTINFKNHAEAIKQWTNVLGLSTTPTSTETVTLGSHQAKRERWENACGYVVLDALTSMGGDHGPSDALFEASFVVPFLGLDKTTATDPEVEQCGTAGMGGSGAGGASGAAGGAVAGGQGGASAGGASGGGANGGIAGASTAGSSGASTGGGGSGTAGGTSGGVSGTAGGRAGSGSGAPSLGGSSSSSGGVSSGGTGRGGAGGSSGSVAGSPASGGAPFISAKPPEDTGCSCRVPRRTDSGKALALMGLLGLAAACSTRRRSKRSP